MKCLGKILGVSVLAGTLALSGCSRENSQDLNDSQKVIDGSSYVIDGGNVRQTTSSFLDDGKIKIGVVSDIEGAISGAERSAEKLRGQEVDAIVIAGDCYENENIRRNPLYPNSRNNSKEMFEGIKPYAELGVPVFVIAGNHERRDVYNPVISKLQKKFPNVFDINGKEVDLEGVNLVGMGGYHNPRFTTQNGFLLEKSDYETAKNSLEKLSEQGENMIFVTHGPPKSKTHIDYVQGAGHVGDDKIKSIMNSDLRGIVNVHGHIHEGGGNFDKYDSGNSINVASITSYNNPRGENTGLITIEDGRATYSEVR